MIAYAYTPARMHWGVDLSDLVHSTTCADCARTIPRGQSLDGPCGAGVSLSGPMTAGASSSERTAYPLRLVHTASVQRFCAAANLMPTSDT